MVLEEPIDASHWNQKLQENMKTRNCIMLIENHPLHFLLSPRNFCKSDKWQTDDKDKTVKVANLLIAKRAKFHPNEKYFYLIV